MKPSCRLGADQASECIDFVPKQDLDRAQQEIERLKKENERLKQETDRLRRELEAALRASKRQAAPHSRGHQKPTHSGQGVSRAAATAGRRAARFRRAWMNRSPFQCRRAARIVAAAWSRKAAKLSIKKRSSGGPAGRFSWTRARKDVAFLFWTSAVRVAFAGAVPVAPALR